MRTSNKTRRFAALSFVVFGLLALQACEPSRDQAVSPSATRSGARLSYPVTFYALTDGNQLLQLNTNNPSSVISTLTVSNLGSSERLVAIDFRPATGQLYGVTSGSRLYTINTNSGRATALGAGAFSPTLTGDVTAFDFNPTVDRIRLVTNRGQNLRLNPETGAVQAIDGTINGAGNVAISGVAYTNSFAGATTTTLYDLDPITDKLYRQDPPNNGTLVEVGSLGVDIIGASGFDIAFDNTAALASVGTANGQNQLHDINLTTGQATLVGTLPGNYSIIGLTVLPRPVAYAVGGMSNLLIFEPSNPAGYLQKTLTGLQSGEMILGIDFRPANGQLYAVTNQSRLYTINTSNGAATLVGSGPFSPAVEGVDIGFDFNPTVDRIRLTTQAGQNLRLNPNDGTVAAVDGRLNPGSPNVTASAYTNNFAGATATILYNIDSNSDRLVRQDPPNAGGLVDVGPLGINVEGGNGFDIVSTNNVVGGTTNMGYAILRQNMTSRVYSINLSTGAATSVADFPVLIQAMAVGLGF